jgi:phosphohistidine phosphatase SixA
MLASRLACGVCRSVFSALAAVLILTGGGIAAESERSREAWASLGEGGHVALIRHGNAPPGHGGDPPGFRIADCATQRNLDERGREQARVLGEAFRARGVRVDRVLSSPWCRCLDTARLMAVGPAESSWALVPDLNPSAPVRLRELKDIVSGWRGPGTLVLVTHAFTVRALLGFPPEQAETVVVKPAPGTDSGGHLVGRIPPPSP